MIRFRYTLFFPLVIGCGKADSSSCESSLCPDIGWQLACVDLLTDTAHCGACGRTCGKGEECTAGTCTIVCELGEVDCGGECTLLGESKYNCGSCGKVCKPHESCQDGECTGASACEGPACECEAEQTSCLGVCVDLDQNESHCGACRSPCLSTEVCEGGECQCPDGMLACQFGCLAVTADSSNCGACGGMCPNGSSCDQGSCECPNGLTACDGTCVDLAMSRFHCGECGNQCQSEESCTLGACVDISDDNCDDEARFVDVSKVALYQGVEVPLFSGQVPIPVASRPVDIVSGRDALVRVFVAPHEGYSARQLGARFSVQNGGQETSFVQTLSPLGVSTQDSLASTFNIFVPGDALQGDTHFKVELLDCEGPTSGNVGNVTLPVNPEWQPLSAAVSSALQVAIVPISHENILPDTSDETMEIYARELERQFPTLDVAISVTDPISSGETGREPDFDAILDLVTDKRAADGVSDAVYYYGLIDPTESLPEYCDGGCLLGLGWYLEDTGAFSRAHRTAMGVGFGSYGANTFVHELGHNLGRDHAPCATSGDELYPHPGAIIGAWGYDQVGGVLKAPSAFRDVMSYCEPNWVSDYTYQGVLERLMDSAAPRRAESGGSSIQTWRAMRVSARGARWVRGLSLPGSPASTPEVGVVYDSAGDPLLEVEVYRLRISDSGGYKLLVPEKQSGWYAVGAKGELALPYE